MSRSARTARRALLGPVTLAAVWIIAIAVTSLAFPAGESREESVGVGVIGFVVFVGASLIALALGYLARSVIQRRRNAHSAR